MKALTTAGLTKLIQLIKSSFISNTDTVTTNTVTLATVATSGSYNDLSNQPTIGNGTITFTQGGVTKGTITANQTGNSTIAFDAGGGGGAVDSVNGQTGVVVLTASDVGALPDSTTIPTMTSQLTNDSGFITNSALSGYATESWVNNKGYITGITSSDVTTALGYTPYNSTNPNGYITSSALTNYVTTDTAQDISGRKTFLGEKAIYFKQSATTNKLGFTLYNPSSTELGAFEWRPSTIGSGALLNINVPYSSSNYVGFRYWGTAVNIVAPKVATAGNYYIPTHITNGSTTVTASNNGTVNISTLLPTIPTIGNGTITINQGGTQKGTFTVNQSGNTTINLDAGGGGTVDQTFDGTSANAQSGVAIAGAGFLQNTAGASGSLAILGTTSYNYAIALGDSANANDTSAIAIGYSAYANYPQTIALGISAQTTAAGTVAIGGNATATAARAHAFGYLSEASASEATALGYEAKATASGALQIGTGTNNTANTLQVSSYTLLDTSTGLIPDARISTNIARTTAIPDISTKQDTLVSGTNIKTINNTSLLGSGNIDTKEIFIAEYNVTPFADIKTAYDAGKTILCIGNGTESTAISVMCKYRYITQGGTGECTFYSALGYVIFTATAKLAQGTTTWESGFTALSTYDLSNVSSIDSSSAVATALNGKADTDLSNLSATGQAVIDGQWVDVDQSIISSATSLNGSTGLTYRVDLPNDGHKYEVMIRGAGYANSTAGNDLWILVTGNQDSMARYMCRARAGTAGTFAGIGTVICTMSYVASSEKNLTLSRSTSWNGSCSELKVIAYRRIGTNS